MTTLGAWWVKPSFVVACGMFPADASFSFALRAGTCCGMIYGIRFVAVGLRGVLALKMPLPLVTALSKPQLLVY